MTFPSSVPSFRFSSCFAPGHITGFFEIADNADPHIKGSRGCGIVPDIGLTTTIRLVPLDGSIDEDDEINSAVAHKNKIIKFTNSDKDIRVFLNGSEVQGNIVKTVLSLMKIVPPEGFSIEVSGVSDLPVGCGFGMSAAGALGTAFTANDLFSLGLPESELIEIAHVAEVTNGSGLGDVAGCSTGGLVLREVPGGSHFGKYCRIPSPSEKVFCLVLGELDTSSVLSDPVRASMIKKAGHDAMEQFSKNRTLDSFMEISLDFTKKVGLMSETAEKAILALDSKRAKASQAMLGNTVFAIAPECENEDTKSENENYIYDTLSQFGNVLVFNIGFRTPELI